MNHENNTKIINALAESLDIPDAAYEAASNRYSDLGQWLSDKNKAKSAQFSPSILPQGSFALGTAIKPWKSEDYDLDLVCTLSTGITKLNCTQENLKKLLGTDIDKYIEERGIIEPIEEKHRCWRINYRDHLNFHIDTTPCIPQSNDVRMTLKQRMLQVGSDSMFAQNAADLSVAITDNRLPNFNTISTDWPISNPEGYAKWFEWRMKQAHDFLAARAIMEKVSKVDDLPKYKWKTPLQRCIQILKRHRDIMFEKNPESKPISIIITTLAAKAYQGEADTFTALENILKNMGDFINPSLPRVPNPVNPYEDFADKWNTNQGQTLKLEQNFWLWLEQVRSDFNLILSSNSKVILEQASIKFGSSLDENSINKMVGKNLQTIDFSSTQISETAKPWLQL